MRAGLRMTSNGFSYRGPKNGVHDLVDHITADSDLFVVTHMGLLDIDPSVWSLTIDGMVQTPLVLRLADILEMPQTEVMAFHECAGSPLKPKQAKRRIGNVVWKGVLLRDVIARAGLDSTATFVWAQGLEWGKFADVKNQPYLKDLPISKAISDDVLLVTEMNGAPLTADRGGPVRLVVPGWYGTNSVKWVGRIQLQDRRAPGPWTTRFYNDPTPQGLRPVWGVAPECVVVAPDPSGSHDAGQITVWGWAWGERPIRQVELSFDGGRSWTPAEVSPRTDRSWQRFSFAWTAASGDYVIMARCEDDQGTGQPATDARNAIHRVTVQIR